MARFAGISLPMARRPRQEPAVAPDVNAPVAAPATRPGVAQLWLLLLWIGATSIGRGTAPYVYEQMVRRRGWLSNEDFTEALTIGKLLPGDTGPNALIFYVRAMRGPLVAALCLLPYMLPGIAIMLALTFALYSPVARAPLIGGALTGVSIAGTGALVATTARQATAARPARFWVAFSAAAFVLEGLLHVNFVLVLLALGLLSLACNPPKR